MRIALLLFSLLLAQCRSATIPEFSATGVIDNCQQLAKEFRVVVENNEAGNAGFLPVEYAQFLHTTRFYDRLAQDVENDLQAQELLSALARLGDETRRSENRNLANPWDEGMLNEISRCSFAIATDSRHAELRTELVDNLQSHPTANANYSVSAQWFGLYPLLRPIFKWRIEELHKDERIDFLAVDVFQTPITYAPSRERIQTAAEQWLTGAYQKSPLKLPQLDQEQLEALLHKHAPTLTVESLGQQDRIGTPNIENNSPNINTDVATAYTLPTFTYFAGRKLLQLNYVFWFPAREPRTLVDIYSGEIDSLIWRVTLDEQGAVLLYDSIHSCGCYHKFYVASDEVQIKDRPASDEPANSFDLTDLNHNMGMHLSVTSNEHFIVNVSDTTNMEAINYQLSPYSSLFNLRNEAGFRSFFDNDGIIAGSERLERFTLWPTGIKNVGAMRQLGVHAVGFVEK